MAATDSREQQALTGKPGVELHAFLALLVLLAAVTSALPQGQKSVAGFYGNMLTLLGGSLCFSFGRARLLPAERAVRLGREVVPVGTITLVELVVLGRHRPRAVAWVVVHHDVRGGVRSRWVGPVSPAEAQGFVVALGELLDARQPRRLVAAPLWRELAKVALLVAVSWGPVCLALGLSPLATLASVALCFPVGLPTLVLMSDRFPFPLVTEGAPVFSTEPRRREAALRSLPERYQPWARMVAGLPRPDPSTYRSI